jgi:hypothetical protein
VFFWVMPQVALAVAIAFFFDQVLVDKFIDGMAQ